MTAYNKTALYNLFVQQQVSNAFDDNIITNEEKENIYLKYPVSFYSPNFFIRVGLFVLTVIILLFSFGVLSLMFLNNIDKSIGALAIIFSLLAFAALEIMVLKKKHYRSGVDDALLWLGAGSLLGGLSYATGAGALVNCIIIFIIALFCTLRFADRLMAAAVFFSVVGIFFYGCTNAGSAGKAIVPFVIMGISAIIYFAIKKLNGPQQFSHYAACIYAVEILALIIFYVAGNYFVVRELSNSMFNLNLQPGQSIPFGWLFWIFTVVIPIIYLLRGVQKKDLVLIRVGLLLIAAMVFTIRYYHFIVPLETAMSIGGIALVSIAWVITRYLHTPKNSFTSAELKSTSGLDNLHIESLILAETFTQQSTDAGGNKFGGGSFGGGGASGDF